jgi:hypothetical protein
VSHSPAFHSFSQVNKKHTISPLWKVCVICKLVICPLENNFSIKIMLNSYFLIFCGSHTTGENLIKQRSVIYAQKAQMKRNEIYWALQLLGVPSAQVKNPACQWLIYLQPWRWSGTEGTVDFTILRENVVCNRHNVTKVPWALTPSLNNLGQVTQPMTHSIPDLQAWRP